MTAVWIIIIVGMLALLQVLYYQKRALKKVSYTRSFSKKQVFAGEKVELVEVLKNEKLAPVPWVRVESRISPYLRFKSQKNLDIAMDSFHKSLFFLGGYSRITRRHEISCLRRGYYDCSEVYMAAGDLFGLASVHRDFMGDAKLYVYPLMLRPEELPQSALKWQGDVSVKRWIMPDPILVNGIREYRPGDSQKDVHWGATAKTGVLQVKNRDYTVSPRVLLCLNVQINDRVYGAMEPKDIEYMEKGVNVAASLAGWCCSNGVEVGFCSNGEDKSAPDDDIYISPARGENKLKEILRSLAVLNIKMRLGIHAELDRLIGAGTREMDIAVISAYWSDSIESRVKTLRRMNNSVSWVKLN